MDTKMDPFIGLQMANLTIEIDSLSYIFIIKIIFKRILDIK
jgi:hypothetical protein